MTLAGPSSGGAECGWSYFAQWPEQGIANTPGWTLSTGQPRDRELRATETYISDTADVGPGTKATALCSPSSCTGQHDA